jgi:hypothetical protein
MRRWLIPTKRRGFYLISILIGLALIVPLAAAQSSIATTNDRATIEFPDTITFSASFKSDTDIKSVVLEYGVDQLTCGTVIAKAFPDIQPGKNTSASWTWEMKQSGSLPPGADIWWHWRVTDAQGRDTVTDQKSIIWLDSQHAWQTIDGGSINLHWYGSSQSFGRELHDSAVKSLDDLAQTTGVKADRPIDLYIYANQQDLRDAILYEPGWVGGQAFPENDIVIIGISADQITWGERTQAHELTHVLVGHLTFTCLGDKPTWLNEGLAMVGEGGPEPESVQQLEKAVADDTLVSVRSLSGSFSENPNKADLSYSESYSLVNFLIKQYGQDKMLTLLKALRDGATVDDALTSTYGFDIDGFEDAWRASINAKPRAGANTRPTPTPVPTEVPTFVPVSIARAGPTLGPTRERPTSTPVPTSTPPSIAQAPANQSGSNTAPAAAATNAPSIRIEVVIAIGLGVILIIGLILFIMSRRRSRRTL